MALYFDTYEIEIKIDGKLFEEDVNKYSFYMTDSIYDLYSECKFKINDSTGVFQEYLLDIEGFKYEVKYGYKDEVISNNYVVADSNLSQLTNERYFSGIININLVHDYYEFQEIKSESFKDSISNIISSKVKEYNKFTSTDITPTQCNTFFIQPLLTDGKFISNILLPNAYSNNSKDSPFFAYINNKNEFNFKNYKELAGEGVKIALKLNYLNQTNDKPERTTILDIKRITSGTTVHEHLMNRLVFQQSQTDGSLIEETDGITSYPILSKPTNKIPIIKNDKLTGWTYLYNEETNDTGLKECYLGQKINGMKEGLFIEKLLLTIPLQTSLNSGGLVEVTIPSPLSESNDNNSTVWSGNYLIEKSTHVWDGENKNGYTQLLVSKKYIQVATNSYILASQLTGM